MLWKASLTWRSSEGGRWSLGKVTVGVAAVVGALEVEEIEGIASEAVTAVGQLEYDGRYQYLAQHCPGRL